MKATPEIRYAYILEYPGKLFYQGEAGGIKRFSKYAGDAFKFETTVDAINKRDEIKQEGARVIRYDRLTMDLKPVSEIIREGPVERIWTNPV